MPFKVDKYRIIVEKLSHLFDKFALEGCDQIGPVFRDGAIMVEKLGSFDDLAVGFVEEQDSGQYKVIKQANAGNFEYTVGPQSFKKFLHPPKRMLWSGNGSSQDYQISVPGPPAKMVFWGVRNCDISAIKILDKVFLDGPFVNEWYQQARQDLVIISVGCTHPSKNCFCTSLGSGPMPTQDFDLNLVEVKNDSEYYLVAESGSKMIDNWLVGTEAQFASNEEVLDSIQVMEYATDQMPLRFNSEEVTQVLRDNLEHPHWEEVANRCLSCANCTLVCPTCFCTTTEDVTDITGDHTERWLKWDSCFVGDFSYIHGGQIRQSTKSRYRQWMTHKLSHWHDQFGSSGCVGCGRCIAWCPVGIDITEELAVINSSSVESDNIKSKDHERD